MLHAHTCTHAGTHAHTHMHACTHLLLHLFPGLPCCCLCMCQLTLPLHTLMGHYHLQLGELGEGQEGRGRRGRRGGAGGEGCNLQGLAASRYTRHRHPIHMHAYWCTPQHRHVAHQHTHSHTPAAPRHSSPLPPSPARSQAPTGCCLSHSSH